MKATKFTVGNLTLALMLLLSTPVHAALLTLDLNTVFTGDTPGGNSPYMTAVFDDTTAGAGYDVRLTLSNSGLSAGQDVPKWYFNFFDEVLSVNDLQFAAVDVSASNLFNGQGDNGAYVGNNAFQADGDGLYDIHLNFPPPPGGGGNKFMAGETVVLDIRNALGEIDVSNFNYGSAPGGNNGTFLAAAHVQSTPGPAGSGWVGAAMVVPEPISSALFLLGGGAMVLRARKNQAKDVGPISPMTA